MGTKVKQVSIYVGLNDSETYKQEFDTEKYISILKTVCKNYRVAFSMHQVNGGYIHDDGTFVEENTLVLTLIDTDDDIIHEIAKDLCVFFHQESVLVSTGEAEIQFISETL